MAAKHILAIDQGTTSTRAIVFDASGRPVASAQKELPQIFPKPGWVEHDPEQIWSATVEVCREALARAVAIAEQQGSETFRRRAAADRSAARLSSRRRCTSTSRTSPTWSTRERKSGSHRTLRWREQDSNHRSRVEGLVLPNASSGFLRVGDVGGFELGSGSSLTA